MARSTLTDYLQVFPFWLMDSVPMEGLAVPVFTPLLGFSSISAPEMTAEVRSFNEGNWFYQRKVITKASVGNIILTRGSTWYDSDFWRWFIAGVHGNTALSNSPFDGISIGGPSPRRSLILIQYIARSPLGSTATEVLAAGLTAGLAATTAGLTGASAGGVASAAVIGAVSGLGASFGPVQIAARIPAKAWLLYDCLPIRYKPSEDFNASSSDVSVASLELACEQVEEISLTA